MEVYFDQLHGISKAKADQLLLTHHRLYRLNTADATGYQLVGAWPIYCTLEDSMTSAQLTLVTEGNLNIADFVHGVGGAEGFWIKIDEEIMFVSTVSGLTWTVTRAQKGTTAAAHDAQKPIYTLSITDNVAYASLGNNSPVDNDIVGPCRFLTTYSGSLIVGGLVAYPNRINYTGFDSELLMEDADIIKEDSWHDINPNDGDELRAGATFQNSLFLFKERSSYYIAGDIDADIPLILPYDTRHGATGQKALVQYQQGMFSLSRSGILYWTQGNVANISFKNIQPFMDTINWKYAEKSAAVILYDRDELWVTVPTATATTPDKTIVFNIRRSSLSENTDKAFTLFNFGRNSLKNYVTSTGSSGIMGGASTGLRREDYGTADGSSDISSYFVTKDYHFGFPLVKKFRRLVMDHYGKTNGQTVLQYSIDGGAYTTASTTDYATASRTYTGVSISGQGKRIKFKFTSSAAGKLLTKIFSFILDFKTGKIRFT
jgi:hypothetical protein